MTTEERMQMEKNCALFNECVNSHSRRSLQIALFLLDTQWDRLIQEYTENRQKTISKRKSLTAFHRSDLVTPNIAEVYSTDPLITYTCHLPDLNCHSLV